MNDEEEKWEKQKKLKYEHHDFSIQDFSLIDAANVREIAIKQFVHSPENDNVKLIVDAFLGHLAKKGFKIIKVNKQ